MLLIVTFKSKQSSIAIQLHPIIRLFLWTDYIKLLGNAIFISKFITLLKLLRLTIDL